MTSAVITYALPFQSEITQDRLFWLVAARSSIWKFISFTHSCYSFWDESGALTLPGQSVSEGLSWKIDVMACPAMIPWSPSICWGGGGGSVQGEDKRLGDTHFERPRLAHTCSSPIRESKLLTSPNVVRFGQVPCWLVNLWSKRHRIWAINTLAFATWLCRFCSACSTLQRYALLHLQRFSRHWQNSLQAFGYCLMLFCE